MWYDIKHNGCILTKGYDYNSIIFRKCTLVESSYHRALNTQKPKNGAILGGYCMVCYGIPELTITAAESGRVVWVLPSSN